MYTIILSGDSIYTLWQLWFVSVCRLQSMARTCILRLLPTALCSISIIFLITALAVDRLRATRGMMRAIPTIVDDGVPIKGLFIVVTAAGALTMQLWAAIFFENQPLTVCIGMALTDEQNPYQFVPLAIIHTLNLCAIIYMGRKNSRIYNQFGALHAKQSLEMRIQLKVHYPFLCTQNPNNILAQHADKYGSCTSRRHGHARLR